MSTEQHKTQAARSLNCRVITVSDTRGADDDPSGDAISRLLESAGHQVVSRDWVADDQRLIRDALAVAPEIPVVVLTGGTGLTARDVTWKTVNEFCDEPLPAFAALFTQLSYAQVGAAAVLSRAVAGVCRNPERVIFALPGSRKACELAVEQIIAPEAGHILSHLAK